MKPVIHRGQPLLEAAAGIAAECGGLLECYAAGSQGQCSAAPADRLPEWLEGVRAPVELLIIEDRMHTVPLSWRDLFVPLAVLQAEGAVKMSNDAVGAGWECGLSLVERMRVKVAGKRAVDVARDRIRQTAGSVRWWLPARLNAMAVPDSVVAAERSEWLSRAQVDCLSHDESLKGMAAGDMGEGVFPVLPPEELVQRQGGEGNWRLEGVRGELLAAFWALDSLARQGVDEREAAVLRGGEWVRSIQNADGGWGEDERGTAGQAASSAVCTAAAVAALVRGGDAGSESVQRGVAWLVSAFEGRKGWKGEQFCWTLVPGRVWFRSGIDRLALPALALRLYLEHEGAAAASGWRALKG